MTPMTLPYTRHLARFGRICFGLALVAFGVASFAVGDFVAGRAPAWPAGIPGRLAWVYVAFVALSAAGVAIIRERHAVRGALVAAAMVFVWALLRQLPVAMADHQLGGAWTNLGKALALSGGAIGVAGSVLLERGDVDARRAGTLHLIGRCSLGAFLVLAGTQHFLFTQFVVTLVPAWIPGATFWTYLAAVALIAGGIGLVIPRTSRLAAALVGAMIFTWLLVLHIPRGIAMNNRNEWTAVIEALAFSGIAFALTARRQQPRD
jgi:uncharacterized membrane protein